VADQAKIGTDWTADELDLIVADYFAMLADEQAGRAYVKSHHGARLGHIPALPGLRRRCGLAAGA
jgi:hypothetical protein